VVPLRTSWSLRTVLPLRTGLAESAWLSVCAGLTCLHWLIGHPIRPGLIPRPIGGHLLLESFCPTRPRLPLGTDRPTLSRLSMRDRPARPRLSRRPVRRWRPTRPVERRPNL
jgi:hypothetical protein